MSQILDVYELVEDWSLRTNQILRKEIKRLKVGEKGGGNNELFFSLQAHTFAKYGALVQVDISFLDHGRFRDMGAGSGSKKLKIESMAGNFAVATGKKKKKGRSPAKWYSRPFYGRLNALLGAVSGKVMENVVDKLRELETAPKVKIK